MLYALSTCHLEEDTQLSFKELPSQTSRIPKIFFTGTKLWQ